MHLQTMIERFDCYTRRRVMHRPAAVELASGSTWRGIRLEKRRSNAGELPECYFLRHIIVLQASPPKTYEVRWSGRHWMSVSPARFNRIILPAQVPLMAKWQGGSGCLTLELAPQFLAAVAGRAYEGSLELRPLMTHDRFVMHALMALEEDVREGSPAGPFYGESIGTAVIAHLLRKYTDVKQTSKLTPLSPAMLRHVIDYINENLDSDLSLQELAQLSQTDLFRFIRSFKEMTGLTPHQYILRVRIECAKSLLKQPAMPVAEIALRCGFASQSHFASAFRRTTSLSPLAYRKAAA